MPAYMGSPGDTWTLEAPNEWILEGPIPNLGLRELSVSKGGRISLCFFSQRVLGFGKKPLFSEQCGFPYIPPGAV